MEIEKVNQVIAITEQREKVIRYRNTIVSKFGRIELANSSGSSLLIVKRDKDESDDPETAWKTYNSEIKDLECAIAIQNAAEWFYFEVIRALNQQIAEYDKQILSL